MNIYEKTSLRYHVKNGRKRQADLKWNLKCLISYLYSHI